MIQGVDRTNIYLFFLNSPSWHILAKLQNSPEEQTCIHVVDAWQVFAPPETVSLQTVIPSSESQSLFEIQYTDI